MMCEVYVCVTKHDARIHLHGMWLSVAIGVCLQWVLMSMDADPNTYPILILPASNTFYFAITHSLITVNPTMLNPSSIIYLLWSILFPLYIPSIILPF